MLDPETIAADVLLDQRPVCGIGNVYKSEVLFLEGIPPRRSLLALADEDLVRLWRTARDLLRRNLGEGRRVTRFANDPDGPHWVYGRAGRACFRCGGPIAGQRLGRAWRPTYWCDSCQCRRDEPALR
jgi:endonuclease-8